MSKYAQCKSNPGTLIKLSASETSGYIWLQNLTELQYGNCTWNIKAPPGYLVDVSLLAFDLMGKNNTCLKTSQNEKPGKSESILDLGCTKILDSFQVLRTLSYRPMSTIVLLSTGSIWTNRSQDEFLVKYTGAQHKNLHQVQLICKEYLGFVFVFTCNKKNV